MSSVVARPDAHAQPDACPRRQSLHFLGSSAKACDRDLSVPAPARHDRYREQLQCTADFEAAKAADRCRARWSAVRIRSEEHTSELKSLMRNSYAVFCLKNKHKQVNTSHRTDTTTDITTL